MKNVLICASVLSSMLTIAQKKDSTNTKSIDEVIMNTYIKKDSDYSNKMSLKAIEDPQVYSSIDKGVLENQLLFNVDDALRNIPGLQKMWSATNRAGDGGIFVNMRGFVAGSSLRNGLVAPITTSMDAINIEKVEVLKGPSATLFGSNVTSYGGIINRVTKKPFENFGGSVSLAGGSYNYYRVQTDVNAPLTNDKKLLFRLNTAYTNQGTFQRTDAKNSFYAFTPSLTYRPTENLEINAELEMYETDAYPETAFFFYFPSSQLGADNMNQLERLGYDYKQTYAGNGLKTTAKARNFFGQVNYKINKHIKSSTNISTSYSYSNGFNPYFYFAPKSVISENPLDTELGIVRADQSTNGSKKTYFQVQQNFNFDFNIGNMRNRTVAGFDYMRVKDNQSFLSIGVFDWVPFKRANYSDMNGQTVADRYKYYQNLPNYDFGVNNTYISSGIDNIYSGYISNVFTPIHGLNILAGLRYESRSFEGGKRGPNLADSYTQSAWSPKLGVVYQIVPEKISVFGNYQNSFTSNGYYTSDKAGNIQLSAPERANQFEGGFKTNLLRGKINTTLSYYNIKVNNTLLNTGEVTALGQAVQNQAGSLTSQGVELEANAYLIKGFSLMAGVSYNDMKYTQADKDVAGKRPATASSPWLVNFNASYQFVDGNLKGLGFGIGGNYASDNKIVNSASMGTFILPKYFVMNANAFYDTKKFRIGVKVDNFTNERYWNGFTTANAQPLANIMGSVTYKF
ncbi:TonB-dependent receptor [Chryseobacterium piperi]|uniref:TonB-dependent receptor n=1 Tax=Chryseobacterium piperi TaxID=558152 RepID=A0A086BMA9_9FLAO|nr:TonB-dependent receptor [Chryseobacterium piperi]ASW75435.1 TonB-dependent receptor [Chryseobacterium piperi]KFF30073.1 TonB-dependent receptor [Chryseobacterium piperi]